MKNYSKKIADRVKRFLKDGDWKYTFDKDRGIFRFDLGLTGRLKDIEYILGVTEDSVAIHGVSPITADENDPKMMARLAEYFTRVNFGLRNGCFEMDYNDGEIGYRAFIDCEGQELSQDVIGNSIFCIARMFDKYSNGMIEVMFTDVEPKDAVERSEAAAKQEMLEQVRDLQDSTEDEEFASFLMEFEEALSREEDPTHTEEKLDIKTTLFDDGGEDE